MFAACTHTHVSGQAGCAVSWLVQAAAFAMAYAYMQNLLQRCCSGFAFTAKLWSFSLGFQVFPGHVWMPLQLVTP